MQKASVIIGRFQPFHNGHLHLLHEATKDCDLLIVVLGSAERPADIKNPFTDHDRTGMFSAVIHTDPILRERDFAVQFVSVHDYMYSDTKWISELRSKVMPLVDDESTEKHIYEVSLFGHRKDDSSGYLDWFPDFNVVDVDEFDGPLHATDIRAHMFKFKRLPTNEDGSPMVPAAIEKFLLPWMESHAFRNLRAEWNLVSKQKKAWSRAPYPAPFITADAVVVHKGRVLMVKRGAHPGKGLLALPGGYMDLKKDKDLLATALRELEEETELVLKRKECMNKDDNPIIFGAMNRSVRGRIITGAFLWELDEATYPMPKVVGSDDADDAFWVPLEDLPRKGHLIFEDHLEIITKMVAML